MSNKPNSASYLYTPTATKEEILKIVEKLEEQASTECKNVEDHFNEFEKHKRLMEEHSREVDYWNEQYILTNAAKMILLSLPHINLEVE